MFARIYTAALAGSEGRMTAVETHIASGLPSLHIIGLTDTVIKESAQRVRAAMNSSGISFPMRRITVNLSPADKRKRGSHYDLPIAVSLLKASMDISDFDENDFAFFGELALDGSVKPVPGILPLVICAEEHGIGNIVVPAGNEQETAFVKKSRVIGITSLAEAAEILCGKRRNRYKTVTPEASEKTKISGYKDETAKEDFSQVFGQEIAKRAALISAAGGHAMLLMGSPGVGKSMIAKRLPALLPEMTYGECREVTKIYSIAGMLDEKRSAVLKRPLRMPQGNISKAALIGGGMVIKPGEVSLAHKGVLFLDELNTYKGECLEALRQIIEEKEVRIIRNRESAVFPADFLLVCAVNPCPCGYLGDSEHVCVCTASQISMFRKKLSGPLLDRIDLHVTMAPVEYEEIGRRRKGMDTASMRRRVSEARKLQEIRYGKGILNGNIDDELAKEKILLGKSENAFIKDARSSFGMSVRSVNKLIRIARTVADVELSDKVRTEHLAEALGYRSFFDLYSRDESHL